ncbi:MAG: thermostable hemolysin [Azonexus sp.]|nr:thermostable hemolysin [Azonexus sp.]
MGPDAADWGSYYDSEPVVVAGRIRLALDMVKRHG